MFCSLIFVSCSNELDESFKYQNLESKVKRVQFSDHESFFNSWTELSKMNEQELKNWIDENNISLSNNGYRNQNIDDVRNSFIALFDVNSELQIGDSVIWYNDGQLLLVSANSDENEVNINKSDPSKCLVFGKIEKEVLMVDEKGAVTTRGTMGASSISTSNQVEFTSSINPSVYFKYVYELVSYKSSFNIYTIYELFFMNKLEWRKTAGWKEASELRICSTSISGSVSCVTEGSATPMHTNYTYLPYSMTGEMAYNKSLPLASVTIATDFHKFKHWNLGLSFSITQEIKGYSDSRKSKSFYL